MAQPSVASFFNTRKRAAADDATSIKNRRLVEAAEPTTTQQSTVNSTVQLASSVAAVQHNQDDDLATLKAAASSLRTTRSGRTIKRTGVQEADVVPKKTPKIQQQQKLVQFIKKGRLSPCKKPPTSQSTKEMQRTNEETPTSQVILVKAFASKNNATNIDRGMKTPTKQIIKGSTPLKAVGTGGSELKSLVRKELKFDEVKTKISRSAKLQELKASLSRIQDLEKTRKAQEERNRLLREGASASPAKKTPVVQLKEFDKIELEVLTSPSKTFKTPTKLPPPTPDKNELMSPRHTDVSKRVLFSPAKKGSPSKMIVPPAYQRFMSLAEASKAGQLQLPYKYRNLIEVFKALDSVCAMFHNRKECITFKKLKPAVQRMMRKNFTELHLAQIKHIYPEAFIFTQMKMRNYGSASKADYFQLVVSPNVDNAPEKQKMSKIDEDNVLASAQSTSMNPHVMTERVQRFQYLLIQRVLNEHDQFIKSLDPPLSIPKEKVTRWHPDFDLEKCTDIELGHLPQPPNVEKYSSARDILSTARNLFNCATPMERAIERYEAKLESDRVASENRRNVAEIVDARADHLPTTGVKGTVNQSNPNATITAPTVPSTPTATATATAVPAAVAAPTAANDSTATLLKGVPKSLLEKIRAKQAAKALDAMTRRPSQDEEATKYARLPELARHLRNVFVTERKGVLTLEIVIKKIQNSFRLCMTPQELETHLKLIAKEVPTWVAFHEVRKTIYLKIAKDVDLGKVVEKLETVANQKSK